MNSVPSGTVTFLFTDIEGSTRRWQDEPEAMRALLVEHDAILRDVIDKRHGFLFKHTGDGVAAAFASASDAVHAAVEAQEHLREVLPVRMGLHTGEAEFRDGDFFGTTLNRCARLMGVAHGGQIVCSESTASLVRDRDDLRDLGEHRLRDLSRAEHVWQIGAGEFARLRSLDTGSTNLAVQSTTLVGRQALIAELSELLERDLLVTLTGVGGVGKTRLAMEVGAEVLSRFADGVWLVELAPLSHEELVLPTIAETLGIAAQTGEPLATTIVSRLKSKRLLVIIDNCEHLLGPVARLADRLAGSAPGVRVLATSREPLGVAAERVVSVPPLAESTEAVELFIERAARAGAVFDAADQQRAIVDICVRLDGLPLAIELAAARARMMAPTQIAERLNQRFRLLTSGGRTAIERHRTLQATVAWSYGLLSDTERLVFQRLSTSVGNFDLDAAEAIAAGGIVEDFEVLDALGHLVDKSMVLAVPDATGVRYRMLETLRQFAAERLTDEPDAFEVQDRHASYFCERGVTLGRSTGGTDQNEVLDAIDADIDNYRTAFAHLLSTGQVNEVARSVLALSAYWQIRRIREGLRWYQQLLTQPDLDAHRRMRVLAAAADSEGHVGDVRRSEQNALEAVELAEAAGVDPPPAAIAALLSVAMWREDPAAYRQWWERGHQVAMASGHRYLQLLNEAQRAGTAGTWDDHELIEHYERLRTEIHDHGDPLLMFAFASAFSIVLDRVGESERAREMAQSVVESGRRAGPFTHTVALEHAAALEALAGELTRAAAIAAECMHISRQEGFTSHALHSAFIAAFIAVQRHDIEAAAVLITAAARHYNVGIGGQYPAALACRVHAQAAVDAHAGDVTAAQRHGQAMTLDDLITYTLDFLE